MPAITHRYDFVYLFDVINGNPNGDPDAGNLPRMDPETNQGLVTDVCLKRKIRNTIGLLREDEPRYAIYIQDGSILNDRHRAAYASQRPGDSEVAGAKKLSPRSLEEEDGLRRFMCDNFFDVRTFGAVMSTAINCGQVRGPVQLSFARSIEAILPLEVSITRMAATAEREPRDRPAGPDEERRGNRTMGRRYIVPYGLYRCHGFISAKLAERTGFDDTDLELLWAALEQMFDHDRSATRGEMTGRRLVVFRHDSALGNAPASRLFDRVSVLRRYEGALLDPGSREAANLPRASRFADYAVDIDTTALPPGITLIERF
jgi:CRISPR-associated protein Csd2